MALRSTAEDDDGDQESDGRSGRWRGLLRHAGRLRLIITLVIVIGLVTHLALVYRAASALELEGVTVVSVTATDAEGRYAVDFAVTLRNPTGTSIAVDRLTYKLTLEGDLLGSGEKAFFEVAPGTQTLEFRITFKATDLAAPTITLLTESTATLRISGKVTVPAKVLGLWTYTHVTIPYSKDEEVSAASGPGPDPPPQPVVLSQPVYKPPSAAELAWSMSADTDFLRYEVHTSTDPAFTPSAATLVATITDRSTTTATVGDLAHLKTHYFIVRVYDMAGQHADSNRVALPVL
jgi:LEA14-like dessication related protein